MTNREVDPDVQLPKPFAEFARVAVVYCKPPAHDKFKGLGNNLAKICVQPPSAGTCLCYTSPCTPDVTSRSASDETVGSSAVAAAAAAADPPEQGTQSLD